jgi:hypothetical protein
MLVQQSKAEMKKKEKNKKKNFAHCDSLELCL